MKIIPEPILFEWDEGNIDKNFIRHNVTNQEAEEVFSNEPLIIALDIIHSEREQRYKGLGKTNQSRLLFVSFTKRDEKIRIISIRDMNKKEKNNYEKV
ncbi:BrnT family toxin [Candidatus Shapirobacteria bacterium]|nr:BrnT family toxin [Candidatus Shapirobacteria bacterium]